MARIASATHSRFSCSGTERHSKQSETSWATVALKAHPYICGWLQETCVMVSLPVPDRKPTARKGAKR